MAVLRLFAAAREVTGVARVEIDAATVGDMLEEARDRYGEAFSDVLDRSRVWLNGQPVSYDVALQEHDIISVLPGAKPGRPSSSSDGSGTTVPPQDRAEPLSGSPDDGATVPIGDEEALWQPDAPPSEPVAEPEPELEPESEPESEPEPEPGEFPLFRPETFAAARDTPGPRFAPERMPLTPGVPDTSHDRDLWAEPAEDDVENLHERVADEPRADEPSDDEPAEPDQAVDGPPREPPQPRAPREGGERRESGPTEPDGFGFLVPRPAARPGIGDRPDEGHGGPGGEGLTKAATVTILEPPAREVTPTLERLRAAAGGEAAAALRTSAVPVLDDLPDPDPEPDPAESPVPKVRPAQPLAVVPSATRPHARLGMVWAVVTAAAVVAGQGWLAAWLGLVAFVAGSQTAAAWKSRNERPLPLMAAAGAAALPVTAVFDVRAMTGAVIAAVVITLVARLASPTEAPGRDVALTLSIAVVVGMAAAAPVLLRGINIQAPMLLLGYAAAYDAGAYLIGTGASAPWEGPAAGVFTLIPVAMLSAVILVPPFPEASPLALGAVAALLAPFGPLAGSALLGDRSTDAPGLRRLDSLLVMGPVWAWCAAAFLH